MKVATLISVSLVIASTSASAIPFLEDKDFGLVTFDHKYHHPLRDGTTVPVKCGTFTSGIREDARFSMGPHAPFDLKNTRPGTVTVRKSDTDICFHTNSTVPCIIRAVTVSNSSWSQILTSFPGGTSDFENCYQKESVALVQGYQACMDLRVFALGYGDGGMCGGQMRMWGPRGDASSLAWRCDELGGDYERAAVVQQP
ncbi:hypothetical protein HK097_008071 [Rhizophlyctis rosea]|uniref:Uncharacterized protein n=1 Tax=Rhizophlyctis rosea TaxID=64517 RepID=A0AAD5SAT7_9FUNG|nr:hypothetical protein HK097_008071 [Rhizophlyctis rosea]